MSVGSGVIFKSLKKVLKKRIYLACFQIYYSPDGGQFRSRLAILRDMGLAPGEPLKRTPPVSYSMPFATMQTFVYFWT